MSHVIIKSGYITWSNSEFDILDIEIYFAHTINVENISYIYIYKSFIKNWKVFYLYERNIWINILFHTMWTVLYIFGMFTLTL